MFEAVPVHFEHPGCVNSAIRILKTFTAKKIQNRSDKGNFQ